MANVQLGERDGEFPPFRCDTAITSKAGETRMAKIASNALEEFKEMKPNA